MSEGTVILDFYAKWCGPCKEFGPKFEEAATKYKSATFIKVDSDEHVFLGEKYNISSLPTVIILKNGQTKEKLEGYLPSKFLSLLEQHVK